MQNTVQSRINPQAGIAIGPILFVVAILAILATAIAAGSSTFATNASQETNRTNAGAMLQIGQTLKLGTDRVMGLGATPTTVTFTGAATTADIFSVTGGGLVPPSTSLAAIPNSATPADQWMYTWGAVTGLGTAALERIAAIRVGQGVCDQINTIGSGVATPAASDLGAIANATNFSAWPAGLSGKLSGCVNNSNATSTGYYFYQVLAVQ